MSNGSPPLHIIDTTGITATGHRVVPISGVAHATPRLRRKLRKMFGERKSVNMLAAMQDLDMVDGLTRLLKQAFEHECLRPDGTVSYEDVAIYIARQILENQR